MSLGKEQSKSDVLTMAASWNCKILHVDGMCYEYFSEVMVNVNDLYNIHMSCLIVHFGINSHNISMHTLKSTLYLLAVEKELKKLKPVPGKLEEPKRTVNEDTGNEKNRLFLHRSHEIMCYIYIVSYGIRIMLGVLTLLGLYQDVFVLTQA